VAFLDPLERHANIHTDTAGVRRFDLLVEAVRRAGPQKVLFGSDGPWLHPGVELAKVRLLGLPPAAEALVLGGNFLRLIAQAQLRRFPARDGQETAAGPALPVAIQPSSQAYRDPWISSG